jgi:hypothetical protein
MDTRRPGPSDLEPDERRALDALGFGPEAPASSASCPDPALLLAARDAVLPDDLRDRVNDHLASCPFCQRLAQALEPCYDKAADAASGQLTPPVSTPATRRATAGWLWLVPAGGLALAASMGWWLVGANVDVGPPPEPVEQAAWLALPEPFAVSVLQANRPDIQGGDIELVFRGEGPTGASPADQALDALDLAQQGRLNDAIRRAERVSARHPGAPEPTLALGALLLETGSVERAITVLEPARGRASNGLRDEFDWYLAVADARRGRIARAAARWVPLCEGGGPRSALACAALDEIGSSRATR